MSSKVTLKLFKDGHIYLEPDYISNEQGSDEYALKIDASHNSNDSDDSIDFTAESETGQFIIKAIKFYMARDAA